MILFKCKINGRARAKKNGKRILQNRKTGKRFIGSSEEYQRWAIFAGLFIRRSATEPTIDYPVNLKLVCHYVNHAHEQDLENIISSVSDVLEDNGVIKNDKLFYSYDGSRKIFGAEKDFIEIEITKIV